MGQILAEMRILVTGGAGFIGSNLIRFLINETNAIVLNVDKLTYAGNLESLKDVNGNSRYSFVQCDICDLEALEKVFFDFHPNAVMHLAAESHVDRSIDGPGDFVETNIVGTFKLLQTTRKFYETLSGISRETFRFLHVSTDEVYGSLGKEGAFTEKTPYDPHSPYSASKAASDHLARAWCDTYKLPVLLTNCSNNYGPYQFPEKLIPVVILKALDGEKIPVYGKGENIRDWLYVEDHAKALYTVLSKGLVGESYNIGGNNEQRNIDLVELICSIMDELVPNKFGLSSYKDLITFVADRPGHDLRYAIDASKIKSELGWTPKETFESGFRKTVAWYLNNQNWWQNILNGNYRLERLGTV